MARKRPLFLLLIAALILSMTGTAVASDEDRGFEAAATTQVDIYLLMDTTGSMGPSIGGMSADAASLLSLDRDIPDIDIAFGAGDFKDFQSPTQSDPYAFNHGQTITKDTEAVRETINSWSASGGGDAPEAHFYAYDQLAENRAPSNDGSPAGTIGWRPGAKRIVVAMADVAGHDYTCSAITRQVDGHFVPYDITEESVTAKFLSRGMTLIAISAPTGSGMDNAAFGNDYVNACGSTSSFALSFTPGASEGQATRMTSATGGRFLDEVDEEEIVEAVRGATSEVIEEIEDDEDRFAGRGREETAIAVSGLFDSADDVVLARADDYADALAGAPLAASLEAPVLLTSQGGLDLRVRTEIERLGASRVSLLGGTAALSPAVESELRGMGLATVRYAGIDRFDTAARIAEELPNPQGRAFLVEGANANPARGWPDAVSVSALAAYHQAPILLTRQAAFPDTTLWALTDPMLGINRVTIVGGTAAVSAEIQAFIADSVPTVERVAGLNRYDTSARVATLARNEGMSPATTWLATGRSFPDALAAAPVAGSTAPAMAEDAGVLLLIDGLNLNNAADSRQWLQTNAASIDRVRAVGGSAVITSATLQAARDAAGVN